MILNQLNANTITLNNKLQKYNEVVGEYNQYSGIFPTFLIAKKNNFTTKKFFYFNYGASNQDPVEKSKEIPQWMLDIEKENGIISK